jgi:hypothetical protein
VNLGTVVIVLPLKKKKQFVNNVKSVCYNFFLAL